MLVEFSSRYIPKQLIKVSQDRYTDGRTALELYSEDGEPLCMATVNLPQAEVPEGHVLIKNYSENEGVMEGLIQAGVIGEPIAEIPTGFVMVQLCPLLI